MTLLESAQSKYDNREYTNRPLGALHYYPTNSGIEVDINDFGQGCEFTPHALNQVFNRWPGLQRYGKELMIRGDYQLLADNLNRLSTGDKHVVQLINNMGMIYGVVGAGYKSYRDIDMIETVNHVTPDSFRIFREHETDKEITIKYISREKACSVVNQGKTRDFYSGFMCHNSEVGAGSLSIEMFLCDSYCDNGMIFGKMFEQQTRYVHRGIKNFSLDTRYRVREDIPEGFVDALKMVQEEKMDVLPALNRAQKQKILSEEGLINQIPKHYGIQKREMKDMFERIKTLPVSNQPIENAFELNSRLTRDAQCRHLPDQTRIEKAAGKLLQCSDKKWYGMQN